MTIEKDTSGASVKFPPPLVFMLFMLMAYAVNHLLAIQISNTFNLLYIGSFFVVLGLAVILIAYFLFKRAQTNIEPWKPTTKIISSSIFAYSRNPIYIALCIITVGIGLMLNNLWVSLSFIPSIVIIFFIAIKKEELYLENKFGQDYISYKEKVRRWF
jgi:protein-S-isoprenylcysteine O-methyltransferase Ste14